MKKIFEEYGSIVVTVVAVCCLIGFCAYIMMPTGVMAHAFGSITEMFTGKSGQLIQDVGSINGNGSDAGGAGGAATLATPAISIDGSILTITPVENATSYEVYNGEELLVTTEETTVDLAAYLSAPNTYSLRVRAVADGAASGYTEEDYVVSGLPALGTSAEDCTWEQIKAIGDAGKADEYFDLGDTKTITLTNGTAVVMEIVAFDADVKADGSDAAAITWVSKNIVARHVMNTTSTNANGWMKSDMRSWLQDEFYNTLPDEVTDIIVPVIKTYYDYTTQDTLECSDSVWIPSYREVFGGANYENSGVDYTEVFKDSASRLRYNSDGSSGDWWLRSADDGDSHSFRHCNGAGSSSYDYANSAFNVVLGFCS